MKEKEIEDNIVNLALSAGKTQKTIGALSNLVELQYNAIKQLSKEVEDAYRLIGTIQNVVIALGLGFVAVAAALIVEVVL